MEVENKENSVKDDWQKNEELWWWNCATSYQPCKTKCNGGTQFI